MWSVGSSTPTMIVFRLSLMNPITPFTPGPGCWPTLTSHLRMTYATGIIAKGPMAINQAPPDSAPLQLMIVVHAKDLVVVLGIKPFFQPDPTLKRLQLLLFLSIAECIDKFINRLQHKQRAQSGPGVYQVSRDGDVDKPEVGECVGKSSQQFPESFLASPFSGMAQPGTPIQDLICNSKSCFWVLDMLTKLPGKLDLAYLSQAGREE